MTDTEKTEPSPEVKAIYPSISQIMAELPAIGKTSRNQQQGFNFRGIDAVYNALNPLFAKHRIFTVPEALDLHTEERTTRSGTLMAFVRLKMRYHFVSGIDGSEVCATTVGEGMDSGDKATNKAMSIAHKYAMFQTFCIPTEEVAHDDPDWTTPEETLPRDQNASQQPSHAQANHSPNRGVKSKNEASQPAEDVPRIDDPGSCIVHFGKRKGTALRDLEHNSLKWYAFTWDPDGGNRPATNQDHNLLDCARAYALELGLTENPF